MQLNKIGNVCNMKLTWLNEQVMMTDAGQQQKMGSTHDVGIGFDHCFGNLRRK